MSLKCWGSKIKSDVAGVLNGLRKFAEERGGKLVPADPGSEDDLNSVCLLIAELDSGETAIGWMRSGLTPELLLHLSTALKAQILSVDMDERVGYEHFSEIHDGKVVMLYSQWDDIREEVNIDPAHIIAVAREKESPGYASRVEKDPSEHVFNVLLSKHDMQMFPLEELLDREDAKCYRLLIPGIGERFMGSLDLDSNKYRFWHDLVGARN